MGKQHVAGHGVNSNNSFVMQVVPYYEKTTKIMQYLDKIVSRN